jgi:hypothetical protein
LGLAAAAPAAAQQQRQQCSSPVSVCLSGCRREQKDAKKEKKLKFKKNFATIQETVLLWEALRPKQTTKEQKQQLVSQIVNKVCTAGPGISPPLRPTLHP